MSPCHRCHRHCHWHHMGEQGTGDDAEASLPALSLSLTRTSVHRCHCHRHRAGKQGTGDYAKASLSALLLLLTCMSVRATAASAIAIAIMRVSKGQVIMPRHHCLQCHRRQRAQVSAAAAAIAIVWASKGQVMMPRHHCSPCFHRQCARASVPPLPPPLRGQGRDR